MKTILDADMLLYLKELWRGKDIYRILMNEECARHEIEGETLDVGSGLSLASYHRFLRKKHGARVIPLDLGFADASGARIDLETDLLPREGGSVDTVLLFNVLEHVYEYRHVVREARRVLREGGALVGAVPFLVGYHPDPRDFWRFTHEALQRIFAEAGFLSAMVLPFGRGPFTAAWSQKEGVYPRALKLFIAPMALFLDWCVARLRPGMDKRKYALGYFFVARK